MYTITEADWKVLRKYLPQWQERYMERLCREYVALLNSEQAASDKFWALEKRIREDKKSTGVVANMTRSEAVFNILRLYYDGAVNLDELSVFSDELQAFVKHYIATFS